MRVSIHIRNSHPVDVAAREPVVTNPAIQLDGATGFAACGARKFQ